jgi:hypothetical protein
LQSSELPGVTAHFLTIPWGPNTFAAMEAPGAGFYNRRAWPFARLETSAELTLAGNTLAPGNYALVFHPNNEKDEGMAFEVIAIAPGEFLKPGTAFAQTPEGDSRFRESVRFDTVDDVAPGLRVQLVSADAGRSLVVHYGNKRLALPVE